MERLQALKVELQPLRSRSAESIDTCQEFELVGAVRHSVPPCLTFDFEYGLKSNERTVYCPCHGDYDTLVVIAENRNLADLHRHPPAFLNTQSRSLFIEFTTLVSAIGDTHI